MHTMKKLFSTLKICATLFAARTFGEYEHSGFYVDFEYARYRLFGKSWCIPKTPFIETTE